MGPERLLKTELSLDAPTEMEVFELAGLRPWQHTLYLRSLSACKGSQPCKDDHEYDHKIFFFLVNAGMSSCSMKLWMRFEKDLHDTILSDLKMTQCTGSGSLTCLGLLRVQQYSGYHEFPKHSSKRNSCNFLQTELIKTRQKFNTDRPEIEGGSKRLRLLYDDAWRGVVALEARPLHKESHIAGHLGLYRSNINTGHWYRFATHASILITAIAEEGRELVRSS
ncbi:hypothetical protein RRG08_001394 [Elysia crispata]|uniref:Uncharacterized protein n=1 Tax=Elysia crispata TaxID=231223 RepID=A0AAE0ZQE3_9GAST|nr:hypothetical protein RRG08_001394 [Elysia crispata]